MSTPDYSSGDSSDRSYDNEPHHRVCPFQTPQFHDQECSRYFDCPTHIIERAGSGRPAPRHEEANGDEEFEDGDNDDEDDDGDEDETEEDFPPATPLSEAGSAGQQMAENAPEHGRNHEPSNEGHERQEVIDLTSSSPAQNQNAPESLSLNNATQDPSSRAWEVIDLTGGDPLPSSPPEAVLRARAEKARQERTLPTIPTPGAGPSSSQTRPGAVSPSAQRRPATPPSPPPPIRRRTSTNNFGTAPRAPPPQLQRPVQTARRPSELVLPRWQPDAEVTICPICGTQFSFLVRKHHCR